MWIYLPQILFSYCQFPDASAAAVVTSNRGRSTASTRTLLIFIQSPSAVKHFSGTSCCSLIILFSDARNRGTNGRCAFDRIKLAPYNHQPTVVDEGTTRLAMHSSRCSWVRMMTPFQMRSDALWNQPWKIGPARCCWSGGIYGGRKEVRAKYWLTRLMHLPFSISLDENSAGQLHPYNVVVISAGQSRNRPRPIVVAVEEIMLLCI